MAALQTSTLVDGVWTTRTTDLNAILQANKDQSEKGKTALNTQLEPPVYGLLTRTIVDSPLINWILPARIRDIDKNDVVFIGVRCCTSLSLSLLHNACAA